MNYLFAFLISLTLPFSSSIPNMKETATREAVVKSDSVINTILYESEIARMHFEDSLASLHHALKLSDYNLSLDVFRYALIGYNTIQQQGKLNKRLLTIIDFTQPSSKKRFYIIDFDKLQVRYNTYVSHGKNTGENEATSFSNVVHSNQSSLGFYLTAETYVGSKGYSLKLDGLEKGYNDKLRERAVVMHEADYVSEYWIKKYGRLGRSQGCPALPVGLSREIIDLIKDHSLIFAYANDISYLQNSSYLNADLLFQNMAAIASAAKP